MNMLGPRLPGATAASEHPKSEMARSLDNRSENSESRGFTNGITPKIRNRELGSVKEDAAASAYISQ